MKKFVFVDSRVFLHFLPLNEIDLPKLLDCVEVEVLITLVVIEALVNPPGNHPEPIQRHRAKETLKQLEKWLEGLGGKNGISSGVTASYIGRQPASEIMKKYRLNWQNQDDMLLATLLEYKKACPDKFVLLLAGNTVIAARARSIGIEVVELSAEHKFVESNNPLSKENQSLHQGTMEFRYHMPHLSLSFAGGKDELTVAMASRLDSLTETMQAQLVAVADNMLREATQYRADYENEATLDDLNTMAIPVSQVLLAEGHSLARGITEEEIERYRHEVDTYPEKFERYLHRCLEMINVHRRTIRLDLELENVGGSSAENVLLILTLPEKLEWYWQPNDRDLPAPPAPPTRPEIEGQSVERSHQIGRVSSVPSHLLNRDYISKEVSVGASPMISDEGTQIKWELGTYRHHQSRLLKPLYARFRHPDDISNFTIAWQISDKNNSGPIGGHLLVLIDTTILARRMYS